MQSLNQINVGNILSVQQQHAININLLNMIFDEIEALNNEGTSKWTNKQSTNLSQQ